MARRQNRKVWNEELARACECRYEMASRNGSRDQFKWQQGAKEIRAVRKDMVEKPNSAGVTNFPTGKLKKTVLELLLDIVAGREPVEPEGYTAAMQGKAHQGNPFEHDSYLKTIKARGGAYAILMAFHHSAVKTLSIDEICARAQPFCDSDMKANYMAGTTHGAWSSNATLLKRGLINRTGGGAKYIDGVGFRGRKNYYTLTSDGEKFTEAMLRKFHQGVAPTAQAQHPSTYSHVRHDLHTAGIKTSPVRTPTRAGRPACATSSSRSNELSECDEAKLRSWVTTAQMNDAIDFKVGKARRKKLHDACDALEREIPGLQLAHTSTTVTDTSNRRTLTVRVIARPRDGQQAPGSAKRQLFAVRRISAESSFSDVSTAKRQRSGLPPPGVAAAQAAFERQAMHETGNRKPVMGEDDAELMLAIKLSQESASKQAPSPKLQEEDELNRVVELSRNQPSPPTRYLEEMEKRAIEESIRMACQTPPATAAAADTSRDSDASDSDDDLLNYSPFGDSNRPIKQTRVRKKEWTAKRSLFPKLPTNSPIDLLSDDDEEKPLNSGRAGGRAEVSLPKDSTILKIAASAPGAAKPQEVIEIDDVSEGNDQVIELDDSQDVIVLDDSHQSISPAAAVFGANSQQLYIVIDNRERNRNSTPRQLRMELTKLVEEGALRSIWPRNMPMGCVEERGLALGDFAFYVESHFSTGRKCIPLSVERKRVSDLVQRSVSGDHWRQFMRMRDNCLQSIFLIETDTRSAIRFTAFGAQELEDRDPFCTLIDDESSIFLFFGRALLSSPSAKFIQTRDETSSLRAVGAVGIMAASSDWLKSKAAKAAPPVLNSETRLSDRLTACGIPWKLARQMGEVLGSAQYLQQLYNECVSDECRSALLAPFITESEYNGRRDSAAGWSNAIFQVFQTSLESRLPSSSSTLPKRVVTIEITQDLCKVFENPTESSFYRLKLSALNPLGLVVPTVVMRTTAGKLVSHRLFVHVLQARSMMTRITANLQACAGDFVALAKDVASHINRECLHRTMVSGKDRRVLLLCGLSPALDAAAKKAGYRTETRAVADMVMAQFMMEHDLVVIQAVRLEGDTEMILRLLALSCYHHHLLFQQNNRHH